jgi:hypothetical protein
MINNSSPPFFVLIRKKYLKKIILLFFIFFTVKINAQITKGYWLVGADGSLTSFYYKDLLQIMQRQTNMQFNSDISYFIIDKLAVGIRPNIMYTAVSPPIAAGFGLDIGPNIRYYFLNYEKDLNVFSELTYQYGILNSNSDKVQKNIYSGNLGLAYFINSAISLEFSIGYQKVYLSYYSEPSNYIKSGIGFHFHLIK